MLCIYRWYYYSLKLPSKELRCRSAYSVTLFSSESKTIYRRHGLVRWRVIYHSS